MDPPVYSYSSPGSLPFTEGAPSALLGALQGSVGPCIQTSLRISQAGEESMLLPLKFPNDLKKNSGLVFPLCFPW